MRERLINRRQQGDLGEASAIQWLTSKGFLIWMPLGHSPDVDLIAQADERTIRVQVKTTTVLGRTSDGQERWSASVITNGGNQSWSGVSKYIDPSKVDYLFVLVGDGRRWLIPGTAIEASRNLRLGGTKYSEFEIESGHPILDLVYGGESGLSTIDRPDEGERRSRRAGPVCKIGGQVLSGFDSHLPHSPSSSVHAVPRAPVKERKLGRSGQAIIRGKRQMTLPLQPFNEAGLNIGDRVRFRADGPGRVILERIVEPSAPQRRT